MNNGMPINPMTPPNYLGFDVFLQIRKLEEKVDYLEKRINEVEKKVRDLESTKVMPLNNQSYESFKTGYMV